MGLFLYHFVGVNKMVMAGIVPIEMRKTHILKQKKLQ